MENIYVEKGDFNKLLATVEILISDVEELKSQNDVVEKRMKEVLIGEIEGKTEEDYNEYLKKRRIEI